jgi:hypothetical protein
MQLHSTAISSAVSRTTILGTAESCPSEPGT